MYAGVVVVYLDLGVVRERLGVVGGISDIYNKSGSCSLIPNLLPGCLVTSQSDGFGVTELQYVLCASGYIKVSTNLHQLRYNSFSNRDIDCMLDRVFMWQKQVFESQNTVKIIHSTKIDRAHQLVIEISTILLQRTRASRPWKVWPLVAAVDCWHPPKHFSPGWHSMTLHRSQQQSVAIGDSCSIALWPGPNVLNCRWWGVSQQSLIQRATFMEVFGERKDGRDGSWQLRISFEISFCQSPPASPPSSSSPSPPSSSSSPSSSSLLQYHNSSFHVFTICCGNGYTLSCARCSQNRALVRVNDRI